MKPWHCLDITCTPNSSSLAETYKSKRYLQNSDTQLTKEQKKNTRVARESETETLFVTKRKEARRRSRIFKAIAEQGEKKSLGVRSCY